MLGRGRGDDTSDPRSSREENVIETLVEKRFSDFGVADYRAHDLGGKITCRELGHELRCVDGPFGRFQDRAVTGGEGGGERRHHELEGVVPWSDDEHESHGLATDETLRRKKRERRFDPFGLHPRFEMLERVRALGNDETGLRGEGFERGLCQICCECFVNPFFVIAHKSPEVSQLLPPERVGACRTRAKETSLSVEDGRNVELGVLFLARGHDARMLLDLELGNQWKVIGSAPRQSSSASVNMAQTHIAAHVDGVERSHGAPGGERPDGRTDAAEAGGLQELFSKCAPHIVEVSRYDDRRSMMKPDEGMALEKLAKLDLSLDSGKPKVEVIDV